MRIFIIKSLLFSVVLLFTLLSLLCVTTWMCSMSFHYKIAEEKTTLITGHSMAECSINDNIYLRSTNMAKSATGYFYSYLKIRRLKKENPQIDTVILGISFSDIGEGADERFVSLERLKSKLPNYLFLCEMDDLYSIYSAVGPKSLFCLPPAIFKNIQILGKGISELGSFRQLNVNRLGADVDAALKVSESADTTELALYETYYLLEINKFCRDNNIKLILLHIPIHSSVLNGSHVYKSSYKELISEFEPNTTLVDYSTFSIPDTCFADKYHLNTQGATMFSEYLQEHR